jgi:predicted DNA-binding transcriptional regulator YafY
MRLFRLTRIQNFVVTDETFIERDILAIKPNPQKSIKQKPDVNLRLRISNEMAYRVLDEFSGFVEKQCEDGSYIVSLCWPEDNWVYSTILSFGEYIEVLEPEHIRDIILEKAKIIYKRY